MQHRPNSHIRLIVILVSGAIVAAGGLLPSTAAADPFAPAVITEQYFSALEAPHGKRLLVFADSGHTPFADEPERFSNEIISRLLR